MSATSLLDRYLSGDRVAVWDEMIRLGPLIRREPVFSEALPVVREVVDRCHSNLKKLHGRLIELGYDFAKPGSALVEADPGAEDRIRTIEDRLGTLPMLVREWYRRFESVNFSQSWPQQLETVASGVGGLGFNGTLIMQDLDACRAQSEEWEPSSPETQTAFLPLGPYASNCDAMGFRLPDLGVDGIYYNDGGGDTYFIQHLRETFAWGGFPFCAGFLKRHRLIRNLCAIPDVDRILPILREGMLPI